VAVVDAAVAKELKEPKAVFEAAVVAATVIVLEVEEEEEEEEDDEKDTEGKS
jgi:hypothetical protein